MSFHKLYYIRYILFFYGSAYFIFTTQSLVKICFYLSILFFFISIQHFILLMFLLLFLLSSFHRRVSQGSLIIHISYKESGWGLDGWVSHFWQRQMVHFHFSNEFWKIIRSFFQEIQKLVYYSAIYPSNFYATVTLSIVWVEGE